MKNATRAYISTFGSISGLMGIEHGFGEILQGSGAAPGLFFPSWPGSPFFAILNGEPAFSILPNMLVSGLLACSFSIVYISIVLLLPHRRYSHLLLAVLSLLMFLSGAGIFPPIFAFTIAMLSRRCSLPVKSWETSPSLRRIRILSKWWPAAFWLTLAFWAFMFPVIPVLAYYFGFSNEVLIYITLAGMVFFLAAANATSKASDIRMANPHYANDTI